MRENSDERAKLLETSINKKIYKSKKNIALAAILSFFIPGLGQFYNKEIEKGLAFFFIGLVIGLTAIALIISSLKASAFFEFGLILSIPFLLFWGYNVYDAYKTAERINSQIDLK